MKWIVLLAFFIQFKAMASQRVKIHAIGSSTKGQYVAIEEYGQSLDGKKMFSKIQVLNLWSNKSVDENIQYSDKLDESGLNEARSKARNKVSATLAKIGIIP